MVSRTALAALACLGLLLPACAQDGHFTLFGYTTAPNYDCKYHTVRVPIFKNFTYRQGLEFDLTRAVIQQIEQKTPYKVVGADKDADTELLGTINLATKTIINRNQLNEIREAETMLSVELIWRDVHTGEILSLPRSGPGAPAVNTQIPPMPGVGIPGQPEPIPPLTAPLPLPGTPGTPGAPPGPRPVVVVQSLANFIPEIGQSTASAYWANVQRLANSIVQMMEKPW